MTALPIEPEINGGVNNIIQAFNAYSPKAAIEEDAPIFINYARIEDFEKAKESLTDLKKIVIAKYGKISATEKVINAMKYEVKGMILYGDPKDYAVKGTANHNVFPNNWWLPGTGIIRESIGLTLGDPQTPNWPSLPEVHQLYGVSFPAKKTTTVAVLRQH